MIRQHGRALALAFAAATAARGEELDVPQPPAIREVSIEGVDRFRESVLADAIRSAPGEVLDREKLAADLRRVVARCHADGYLFVAARVEERAVPPSRVDVVFRVDEGLRFRLRSAEFDGALAFSRAELQAVSGLLPRRGFGILAPGTYTPESADGAAARLAAFYASRGYFDARVSLLEASVDTSANAVDIRFEISEGPHYTFAPYRIEGRERFPLALIEEVLDLRRGGPYSRDEVRLAAERLRDWYLDHSDLVPIVSVAEDIDRDEQRVTPVIRLTEGRPIAVGSITLSGNDRTRDRVLLSRIRLTPGALFTPRDLERSQRALDASGLFTRAEIRARETVEENIVDFDIEVEENRETGFFELGGGASSGAGEVAYMSIAQRNFDLFRLPRSPLDWRGAFVGGGQTLRAEIIPGTKESEFGVVFAEPYLFSTRTALQLTGSSQIYSRESYDETRHWGDVEIRRTLDAERRYSAALSYRVEDVRIDDFEAGAPADVLADGGHTFLAYPRLSLRYDELDVNPYSGPRGVFADARVDIAGAWTGAAAEFVRAEAEASTYFQFFSDWRDLAHTLEIGARAGWIGALDGDRVAIFERYYLGGPRTFRGHVYRGVGPRAGETPLGGELMVHGTIQYSLPLFAREVRALALVDWGTLEADAGSIALDRFRVAAGGGLQLRVPMPFTKQIVPINLYWTEALTGSQGDRERLFTFSLGLGFGR